MKLRVSHLVAVLWVVLAVTLLTALPSPSHCPSGEATVSCDGLGTGLPGSTRGDPGARDREHVDETRTLRPDRRGP